jgi:hypothetical protein
VGALRRGQGTVDSILDYLIKRAYGSPERLLDARDRLGEPDAEARALLLRASRRAWDPNPAGAAQAVPAAGRAALTLGL